MPFSSKSKQREYQREYQRKRRRKKSHKIYTEESAISPEVRISIIITILLAIAVLSILSFFDLAGPFGKYGYNILKMLFGWGAFVFPILLAVISLLLLRRVRYQFNTWQITGVIILFIALLGVMHHAPSFADPSEAVKNGSGGGWVGFSILYIFTNLAGYWGAWVFLTGIAIVGILLGFSNSLFNKDGQEEEDYEEEGDEDMEGSLSFFDRIKEKLAIRKYRREYNDTEEINDLDENLLKDQKDHEEVSSQDGPLVKMSNSEEIEPPATARKKKTIKIPLDLLESSTEKPSAQDIETIKDKIEKTLATFGINIEMDEVNIGPTVTQYTFKPPVGVKLSRITGLANELALALAAHPLRMEAPIPGKSLVGIEIPNQIKAIVKLKDIMLSSSFRKRNSNLSICLGKDVSGKSWVGDLSKMPHLLIAGSTGSGKSVAINSIIISLLYQNSPDDLKLVLVDPKKVELSGYNDIPYLLTPVITDNKKTINALKWIVSEMERRYQLLSQRGKRNIESYNEANRNETLPHLVFIIDELADLMSVAAQDVEGAIVRLAQMSRAVGIHLILATQRPSVNVLTGLIKANIPSRIAFAVPSQIDSRTILDSAGAEKLLGQGDMLFTASDANKPRRLQGAYLSDEEIERVTNFLKDQGEADYHDEITERQRGITVLGGARDSESIGEDELYDDAREEVVRAGKASASLLQRRLRIGYARAARLLDILESEGIIGPADGARPREILIGMEGENEGEHQEESVDSEEDNNRISNF
ncbi:DNA translocase FtsK [Patescibacteria group bacterium]|nr:DNA translocase FtsK [Patescibacteria group bacterium]